MLRIARAALDSANEKLARGKKIQVLVNNSDGKGNSYGSHLDFLITRRAWDNIFRRKIHYMLYLAAFQASSIVYTGQGKAGSENAAPQVSFQISARADFFERLVGAQTTHNRPIVNSRDEALCGSRGSRNEDKATEEMARLHVIFFDNTLCHVASLLKVGVMQIVLAMIEAERVNVELLLDDPVDGLIRWSHDPTLQATAALTSGEELTAVELQLRFLEEAGRFFASGGCDGVVPRAGEILALWEDTLAKLQTGDFASLAPRLDWVLKFSVLQQVLDQNPNLTWNSPEVKHLDHLYSSLDPSEGLYWAYENGGLVERMVTDEQIERFTVSPPEDTRAWARAMLLRWAGPDAVDDVDWDSMRFKTQDESFRTRYRRLEMASPLAFTKDAAERAFEDASTLEELLDLLVKKETL
jgi:proteasome accessory factor A